MIRGCQGGAANHRQIIHPPRTQLVTGQGKTSSPVERAEQENVIHAAECDHQLRVEVELGLL